MTLTRQAAPLLGFVTLFAIDGEPRFDPKEDSTATKTFRESTSLQLESVTAFVDGQEEPGMGRLEFEVEHGRSVVATDVYGTARDGAPVSLRRTFDEIGTTIELDLTSPSGEAETADVSSEHPLVGSTVVFEEDGDEIAVRFADESAEGNGEWLEGLAVDMDLAALLRDPNAGEREVGSRWEVEPAALLAMTRPGGVGFVPFEAAEDDQNVGLFLTSLLSCRDAFAGPEGEVKMMWKSVREIDGTECAVFDLDVDVTGSADLTDRLTSDVLEALPGVQEEITFIENAEVSVALVGEGELTWNLAENRLHSLAIELDNETILGVTGPNPGGEGEIELEFIIAGDTKLTVETD